MLPPPRGPLGLPVGIRFDVGQQRFVCLTAALARHSQGSRQGIHQVTVAFPDPGTYRPGASALGASGSSGETVSSGRAVLRVRPEGVRCRVASRSVASAIAGAIRPTQSNLPGFVAGENGWMHPEVTARQKTPGQQKTSQKRGLEFRPWMLPDCTMVPKRGLEPPRFYPPVPETGASTNSATWAIRARIFAMRHRFVNEKK
jgi:hypothetical protein